MARHYIAYLENRVKELEAVAERLRVSPWFGCLNRNGLDEALALINLDNAWFDYFDVDNLRGLNDLYGKPYASQLIFDSIPPRATDLIAYVSYPTTGQWFSGDELVTVCWDKADAIGYAQRTQQRMHERNFSATHVILPALYKGSAHATLEYADNIVTHLKKKLNQRDCIVCI